jgi:ribonuclease HI
MKKELVIYTDGASRGNPGPGGWGAVILVDGYAMEIAGSAKKATNNQMELQAVLEVLSDSATRAHNGPIVVFSDSAYAVNGLNSWIWGWEKKGWITSAKTPVENKEIWVKLLALLKELGSKLTIAKIKGHGGELYNERCDELAVSAALGLSAMSAHAGKADKKYTHFKGSQKDYDAFLKEIGTTKKSKSSKTKTTNRKALPSGPAYSYVSMVGGKVYADKTWSECEARVKGKKGAKYKKVFSKAEETSLVQDYTLDSLL